METRAQLVTAPSHQRTLWAVIALLVLIAGNWVWHPLAAGPTEPAAPLAHWVGIVGSALVVSAQAYSLKKRTRLLPVGKNKTWLDAHILLGLVGAVLVELHSGPVLYGVSGLSRLALWLVVLSGFAGRYLYSLIPVALGEEARAAQALSDEKILLEQAIAQIAQRRRDAAQHTRDASLLATLGKQHPLRAGQGAFSSWREFRASLEFFARTFNDLAQAQRAIERQYRAEQTTIHDLYARLFQRISLERRAAWLLVSDQAIRVWRVLHVPPCLFLLGVTAMHIWSVLYY